MSKEIFQRAYRGVISEWVERHGEPIGADRLFHFSDEGRAATHARYGKGGQDGNNDADFIEAVINHTVAKMAGWYRFGGEWKPRLAWYAVAHYSQEAPWKQGETEVLTGSEDKDALEKWIEWKKNPELTWLSYEVLDGSTLTYAQIRDMECLKREFADEY